MPFRCVVNIDSQTLTNILKMIKRILFLNILLVSLVFNIFIMVITVNLPTIYIHTYIHAYNVYMK